MNEGLNENPIVVSSVVRLGIGSDLTCEYQGCSGDCDCDGDTGDSNPSCPDPDE